MATGSTPRTRGLAAMLVALLALAGGTAAAPGAPVPGRPSDGSDGSLPRVASGPRPGPVALYADPPRAPQLENTGPWEADPILVSGAEAYRDGEWLYQDFLFDDHGATGVPDLTSPYRQDSNLYSPTAGTFTYPEDPVYGNNAADLVELRIRPGDEATRFRVTLNTMLDPQRTAFTIALGDGPPTRWPHGAGVSSPATHFLTVHGDRGDLLTADGHTPASPAPAVDVDLERRQVDVTVPHAAWDPGHETVRVTIGVGLWDTTAGTYLAPEPGTVSATTPGGGTADGVALVNVGPRFDEPMPTIVGATMADTAVGAAALASWWRERQQSVQLTAGDVTPFAAQVDFGRLARGVTDDSGVPTSGPMNRILASRYVHGQGLEASNVCRDVLRGVEATADCVGRYVGQLQPYAIHVPDRPTPPQGFGLTLLLHSLTANHNQYLSTANQAQLADRGAGSIVVTPEGRGPDGFYTGVPEADVFEVWADVARHYDLDPSRTASSGYSMGGFGTYRLLARWPDLFARGFSVVGLPGSVGDQLASLRHTPLLAWNAGEDELVHVDQAEQAHADLTTAGVEHVYDQFPTADHLTLAGNDEYRPGAAFLGDHQVVQDPATVSYVVDPREDSLDVVADHAYWLSNLRLRAPDAAPTGTIEVHSAGRGTRPAESTTLPPGGGVLAGGNLGALGFAERGMEVGDPVPAPAADRLEVNATNIASVTIDPQRAGVTCDAEVVVDSDGPIEVTLAGCETPGRSGGRADRSRPAHTGAAASASATSSASRARRSTSSASDGASSGPAR